jgi:esterase
MKLFCRKYGNGPPLIILHGLYGSSDNWVTIAKKISNKFTVYLPDQRNHGHSPRSAVHDYDSMREDLFELAGDLKLEKFFLAGHSMGGKTAMSFALKWPEKLYGLLIADISPFLPETKTQTSISQHIEILNSILSIDLSKITTRREVESQLSARILAEEVKGLIMKNLQRNTDNSFTWKINASSLLNNLDGIMQGIERKEIDNTQITGFPVFFLRGEYSDYLPENDFREIQRIFPAAEFIKVAGAGHWIHADNPEAVEESLLGFLDNS